MIDLNNSQQIKKLDKSNVLGSVQQLTLQLKQTYEELKKVKVPASYRNVDKIVVNGMGGSRLGSRVAERLFFDDLKIPLIPCGSYDLPAYVDKKTLLILSSYSGNTEEILNSHPQAVLKKAKIMVIAQGGKLAELARKNHYPGYFGFEPKYNPCNQPRMSIGYQILSTIILLSKAGLLTTIKDADIKSLINWLPNIAKKFDLNRPQNSNFAKQLAVKMHLKIPVLVAAEFMMGALHVTRNQINENAKQLAIYFEIPELNHHLLEGLKFPKQNSKKSLFSFLWKVIYIIRGTKKDKNNQRSFKKNKIPFEILKLTGGNKLKQVFEFIHFGGFLGFYLSMLNQIDPAGIPWVDYFKKELEK